MTSPSLTAVPGVEPRYATLSLMQIEVLGQLLIDGASNYAIGRRINRSEDTIKTHLRRVFEQTHLVSRTELAIRVLRGEIIVIDPDGRRVRF